MAMDSSPNRQRKENGVHDKVAAFNNLSMQARTLERKTNDAALKRAVLGREQAENEARRYREETRNLRKAVEDGQRRERIVGERLESLMESFGRSKENYEYSKLSWEKEIRRLKKESFKLQSVIVKTQEDLKSSRFTIKIIQADLDQEKSRSAAEERKTFNARQQSVKTEQELSRMREQLMLVEKERDALRKIAKSEEIARIAAEGKIPLPISPEDDEFSSPKKSCQIFKQPIATCRLSSDVELDDLRMRLAWEQQRSLRAYERIEFLEIECRLNCCAPRAALPKKKTDTVRLDTQSGHNPSSIHAKSEVCPWNSPTKEVFSERKRQDSLYDGNFTIIPSAESPAPAFDIHKRTSLLSLLGTPEPKPPRSPIARHSLADDSIQNPNTSSEPKNLEVSVAQVMDSPGADSVNSCSKDSNSVTCPKPITREEALAQIKERRGRARSLAQGTMTPRRIMSESLGNRRDVSAPAIRSGSVMGRRAIRA